VRQCQNISSNLLLGFWVVLPRNSPKGLYLGSVLASALHIFILLTLSPWFRYIIRNLPTQRIISWHLLTGNHGFHLKIPWPFHARKYLFNNRKFGSFQSGSYESFAMIGLSSFAKLNYYFKFAHIIGKAMPDSFCRSCRHSTLRKNVESPLDSPFDTCYWPFSAVWSSTRSSKKQGILRGGMLALLL